MIRLGYSECGACHLSPQGGGPLNPYGRGIDRAQSLRGGEYAPATDDLSRALTFGGRTTQDFRAVIQTQSSRTDGQPALLRTWPRALYRNVTDIGRNFRVSATVTGETTSSPRPTLSYEPRSQPSSLFLNTALLHYRAGQVEFAAGRDQLPTGVNVPDLGLWIKSRNRLGYYDAPVQLKMFWTHPRVHVIPFVYTSSGNEAPGEKETGGGTIAEVVLGGQHAVLGVSTLKASGANGDRRTLGGHVRLGFGRWGVLVEHDLTDRTRVMPVPVAFAQQASYGQLFWAVRDWLVASAIGERLRVGGPFEERLVAAKLELAARLASQATLGVSARRQRDQITGRISTSVTLQAAFKTVP
jgi:hypothetical protein